MLGIQGLTPKAKRSLNSSLSPHLPPPFGLGPWFESFSGHSGHRLLPSRPLKVLRLPLGPGGRGECDIPWSPILRGSSFGSYLTVHSSLPHILSPLVGETLFAVRRGDAFFLPFNLAPSTWKHVIAPFRRTLRLCLPLCAL